MTKSNQDNAIYVAIVAGHFDGEDGTPRFVAEGARLRGSDEAVRRYPAWFLADGATDAEMSQARNALDRRPTPDPFA